MVGRVVGKVVRRQRDGKRDGEMRYKRRARFLLLKFQFIYILKFMLVEWQNAFNIWFFFTLSLCGFLYSSASLPPFLTLLCTYLTSQRSGMVGWNFLLLYRFHFYFDDGRGCWRCANAYQVKNTAFWFRFYFRRF